MDGVEARVPTHGMRFFLEGWDRGTCPACPASGPPSASWRDAVALAFCVEPWLAPGSLLRPVLAGLTRPRVGGRPLDLAARYASCGRSLRRLLDFVPDDPDALSLHASVAALAKTLSHLK